MWSIASSTSFASGRRIGYTVSRVGEPTRGANASHPRVLGGIVAPLHGWMTALVARPRLSEGRHEGRHGGLPLPIGQE